MSMVFVSLPVANERDSCCDFIDLKHCNTAEIEELIEMLSRIASLFISFALVRSMPAMSIIVIEAPGAKPDFLLSILKRITGWSVMRVWPRELCLLNLVEAVVFCFIPRFKMSLALVDELHLTTVGRTTKS